MGVHASECSSSVASVSSNSDCILAPIPMSVSFRAGGVCANKQSIHRQCIWTPIMSVHTMRANYWAQVVQTFELFRLSAWYRRCTCRIFSEEYVCPLIAYGGEVYLSSIGNVLFTELCDFCILPIAFRGTALLPDAWITNIQHADHPQSWHVNKPKDQI